MDAALDLWNDLDSVVTTGIAVALILLAAIIGERILVRMLRRAYWRRVERAAAANEVAQLSRMKRQKTLVTLLESLVRYGTYGIAIVVILGLLTGGKANAFFAGSLVAVLVGFGLQRLLGDVVAGALLLFEGHFAVGDVMTVHGPGVTGVVEEFSLRTTSLRTLGGDRVTLMNGSMLAFTRWSYGQREFRLELVARGAGAVEQVTRVCETEGAAASSLWIRPPAVAESEQLPGDDGDLVRIIVTVVVAPGHEALVERLGGVLEASLGEDRTVGPASVLPLYDPSFREWRAGLLLRG